MIDLEDALAPLVENAPEPPAVERVVRRGRVRRRRRYAALTTTVMLIAAIAIVSIATIADRSTPRVAGVPGHHDHVRVTLLDGSQLEISGPPAFGLTRLVPSFNAELDPPNTVNAGPQDPDGHSFTIERNRPQETGAVVGRYPTADGHELVVHETPIGVDAVAQYDAWTLTVNWNHDPTQWGPFAAALDAHLSADGFLVVESAAAGWRLGPTDAPDVQLGESYSFFGPATYPAGCPAPDARSRCDAAARVRIGAVDRNLAGNLDDLQVAYTDADHATDRITTLDGSRYEITAPSSVLDHLVLQSIAAVGGVEPTTPIMVEAERTDDPSRIADAPNRLPDAPVTSADGTQLVVTRYPLGDVALQGTYGDWTVDIVVNGLSTAGRTRVASQFAAHETADGFLVLDPGAAMTLKPGGPEIVLDGADVNTSAPEPQVVVRDPKVRPTSIVVRRVG